jgi:hypothetical protein
VLEGRRFPDGAVKNAWPVEMWDPVKGPLLRYLVPGNYYEIPRGCLRTRKIRNLLCAGRCISVSREALGSTRVMGPCMALGQAAAEDAVRLLA